jgi:amino acid transporter
MAVHGHAPAVFRRLNRFGVPYAAVTLFGLFICLGYMTISSTASTVFTWLQDLVSIATLINWMCICVVYLRFYYGCKKQSIDRHRDLPFAAPWQPYTVWAPLILFTVLLLTGGYSTFIHGEWSDETFVSSYINIPIVLLLYFGYKFWNKSKIIPLDELPIKHFIDIYQRNPEPAPKPKRGLHKLNILWA